MPILTAETQKTSNWKTQLPANVKLLVALRQLDPTEAALVLHPAGTLQVSQRTIPLDLKIDKVGSQAPSDANQFSLSVSGTVLTKTRDLQEPFAPSQFRNFDDATKLSQPAFVPQDSGIELAGGSNLTSATAITRPVRYDLTVVDAESEPVRFKFFPHSRVMFTNFLRGNSAGTVQALGSISAPRRSPYPDAVAGQHETFAVAFQSPTKCLIPRRPHSPARPARRTTSPRRSRPIRRSAARCMSFPNSRWQHEFQSLLRHCRPRRSAGDVCVSPWLRQGIANAITAPPAGPRAPSMSSCNSRAIPLYRAAADCSRSRQDIALYGPGDILGIDSHA